MNSSIQMLPGAEGIKEAYESLLKEKNLDIVCLSENYSDVVGDYFDKEFQPKLNNLPIKTREIIPDNKENRASANKKSGKNQVRFINSQRSESDVILGDNKAVLITFSGSESFAVIICESEIVKNLKDQFKHLWDSLS